MKGKADGCMYDLRFMHFSNVVKSYRVDGKVIKAAVQ